MICESLHIHPLKGGRIVDVETIEVVPTGLTGDRTMMLVRRADGRFLTQRELPPLALLEAVPNGDEVRLTFDGRPLGFATFDGRRRDVTVWRNEVDAAVADDEANHAVSAALDHDVQLVRFDAASHRPVNPLWAEGESLALQDGYPVLLANTASLDAVNARLYQPVPMARFRPNVVVRHDVEWAEDGWSRLRIGEVVLDLVKPCDRCVVTSIDQDLGRPASIDPMPALRALRRSEDRRVPGVLFGWNAIVREPGLIRAGDAVEVVSTRSPWAVRAA